MSMSLFSDQFRHCATCFAAGAFIFIANNVIAQTDMRFTVSPEVQEAYPDIVEGLMRNEELSAEMIQSTLDDLMNMNDTQISVIRDIAVRTIGVSHGEPCQEEYRGLMERGFTVSGKCYRLNEISVAFAGAKQSDIDILREFNSVKHLRFERSDRNILDLQELSNMEVFPGLSGLLGVRIDRAQIKNVDGLTNFTSLRSVDIVASTLDGNEIINALEEIKDLTEARISGGNVRWGLWVGDRGVSLRDHFSGIEECIFYFGECLDRTTDYVRLHDTPRDLTFLNGFSSLVELDLSDIELDQLDMNVLEPVFEHASLEWIIHPLFVALPKSEFIFFAEAFFGR